MKAGEQVSLRIVPVTFAQACAFITDWHRHHRPPQGHKFSLGVAADEVLVGVAVVGRPVARLLDDGQTLELTRVAVADATPNVCSLLYAAAWRAAKALGYRRLITYTQKLSGSRFLKCRSPGTGAVSAVAEPTPEFQFTNS
jgi:hypothetical protein